MFGIRNITARRRILLAWMPEGSKGADLRSAGRLSAWVRTPLQASCFAFFLIRWCVVAAAVILRASMA